MAVGLPFRHDHQSLSGKLKTGPAKPAPVFSICGLKMESKTSTKSTL